MYKHMNIVGLILAALIVFGASAPTLARSSGAALLSLCIRNIDRCYHSCYDFDSPYPPTSAVGSCWAQCDANHAACVDRAFGSAKAFSKSYRRAHRRLF